MSKKKPTKTRNAIAVAMRRSRKPGKIKNKKEKRKTNKLKKLLDEE